MLRYLIFILSIAVYSQSLWSATLNVLGGELVGASGVVVDGETYDVEFLDGTCVDVFNGCDEASDFVFQTALLADMASQSLVDQVFGGSNAGSAYDLRPAFTRGIVGTFQGFIMTPFSFDSNFVKLDGAANSFFEDGDVNICLLGMCIQPLTQDLEQINNVTYAVWTPTAIPVPAAIWLFGTALIGLVGLNRRKSIKA